MPSSTLKPDQAFAGTLAYDAAACCVVELTSDARPVTGGHAVDVRLIPGQPHAPTVTRWTAALCNLYPWSQPSRCGELCDDEDEDSDWADAQPRGGDCEDFHSDG